LLAQVITIADSKFCTLHLPSRYIGFRLHS